MASTPYAMKVGRPTPQTTDATAFIGGHPLLAPDDIWPACTFCDARMTFLMQVTPPADHPWAGWTISHFECTSCPDQTPEQFLAPGDGRSRAEAEARGVEIDDDYLAGAQSHRRLVVGRVEEAVLRRDIEARVPFQRIELHQVPEPYIGMKVGGWPSWGRLLNGYIERATYQGQRVVLLYQVPATRRFTRLPTAPIRADFFAPTYADPPFDPADMEQRFYQLPRNAFVFGTVGRVPPAGFLVSANDLHKSTGDYTPNSM